MIFYEDTSYEVGALVEEAAGGKPKKLYLKGVFAESENKNKNGRIYDRAEMLREVDRINTAAAQGHYVLGEWSSRSIPTRSRHRTSFTQDR